MVLKFKYVTLNPGEVPRIEQLLGTNTACSNFYKWIKTQINSKIWLFFDAFIYLLKYYTTLVILIENYLEASVYGFKMKNHQKSRGKKEKLITTRRRLR